LFKVWLFPGDPDLCLSIKLDIRPIVYLGRQRRGLQLWMALGCQIDSVQQFQNRGNMNVPSKERFVKACRSQRRERCILMGTRKTTAKPHWTPIRWRRAEGRVWRVTVLTGMHPRQIAATLLGCASCFAPPNTTFSSPMRPARAQEAISNAPERGRE
jgi:hypothetical protein